MSTKSEYRKSELTSEQRAEIAAVREKYQREKPSLEQALAASGADAAIPLGELLFLHTLLAALKQERERQGIAASVIAERAGIDPAVLSRLETGRHANPTLRTVERVAAALGKVVKWHLDDAAPAPTDGPPAFSSTPTNGRIVVTDAEILAIWNQLTDHTYTEARVLSCVVAAHENNGEIVTSRAKEVMQVVWPMNTALGAVPSEIRGNTANTNNNRNRQADFARLSQVICRVPSGVS